MINIPSQEILRASFVGTDLFDFGNDVAIVVRNKDLSKGRSAMQELGFKLSRAEAQQLFDDLWRYHFRPTESA